MICEAENFRHCIPRAHAPNHQPRHLHNRESLGDRQEIWQVRKDACTNVNVEHAYLIDQEKLQRDQLCHLLIGSLAEVKLAFVFPIEAKRVV